MLPRGFVPVRTRTYLINAHKHGWVHHLVPSKSLVISAQAGWGRLLRQADLLAQSCRTRVATQQREFRVIEIHANTLRAEHRHAVRRLQGPVSIAQTGED